MASIGFFLLALQATVIDTVKIKAAAIEDHGRVEFEERRRSGAGRYVTQADIAKRQVSSTSEVFRSLPGMQLRPGKIRIFQRGIFTEHCLPSIYINGAYMSESLWTDDLDTIVNPQDLIGIEIYVAGTTPAQYQRGLYPCGTILFWTKDPRTTPKRRIPRGTVFAALFTVTSLVALSRLFGPD